MKRETAIGQLRHAYSHLAAGTVKDQKGLATGLLGPAIAALEAPDPLRAFVEQMARLTTLDDEFDTADEEGVKLRAQYDDVSDYQSDLGDERLCDEFEAFQDMIRAARELLA